MRFPHTADWQLGMTCYLSPVTPAAILAARRDARLTAATDA